MIADSVPPDAADRVRAAVASLTAEPNIAALDDGIRVTLVMTVPDVPASDRDSRRCVFAHAGRTQSLPGHARSMGRVHGFFDQAAWRRGRRPAVPRSVAANPARQPLSPRRCAEQSVGRGGPDPVRLLFLDEWTPVARRGPRGGAARDAWGARARIHVVHLGRRRVICARSGRARAGCAHLGGRPSPPRAYHGANRDRRSASVQLRRRSRPEKTFRGPRAAGQPPPNRRRKHPALNSRRISRLKHDRRPHTDPDACPQRAIVPKLPRPLFYARGGLAQRGR